MTALFRNNLGQDIVIPRADFSDAFDGLTLHMEFGLLEEIQSDMPFVQPYRGCSVGRPEACRPGIARAYIAKAALNLTTTRELIDRLRVDKVLRCICGFEKWADVPKEWTFSRAFAEFAEAKISERVHAALIKKYRSDCLIGYISRDATAIEAREKISKAEVVVAADPPKKRGRPKKWARKGKVKVKKTRLERQFKMKTVAEMLTDIPTSCDVGTKKDSKGYKITWRGYKLHIDTADGDIPLSCILTSASVHDSQVALPLALMTSQRVTNCYDLMDSAYDSGVIRVYSLLLKHVALIDFNRRTETDARSFAPHEVVRYRERSAAEHVNSRLKDSFGARFLRVKGSIKAMAHLMFGVVALTVEELIGCIPKPA